jgi:hypothetical protein
MKLNDYIMKIKLGKEEDMKRIKIDVNFLSKLKIAKKYEFSEKLTLPCI